MLHPTSCTTSPPASLHNALSTTSRHGQGSGTCCPQSPALPGASTSSLPAAARFPVVPSQPFLLVFSLPGMQQVPRAVGPGCLQQVGRQGARASPSLVPELGFCPCQGASQQHHAVVLWLGLDADPPSPVCCCCAGLFSGHKGGTLPTGVEGVSIVVLEEGFRAESISVRDTAHLEAHLATRDPSSELPHAWGCPGMPSWNWEWFEPWLPERQSRLGWRKFRVGGFSIPGGGREQLGQWAQELCCAGLNVTSVSPNMAGG